MIPETSSSDFRLPVAPVETPLASNHIAGLRFTIRSRLLALDPPGPEESPLEQHRQRRHDRERGDDGVGHRCDQLSDEEEEKIGDLSLLAQDRCLEHAESREDHNDAGQLLSDLDVAAELCLKILILPRGT